MNQIMAHRSGTQGCTEVWRVVKGTGGLGSNSRASPGMPSPARTSTRKERLAADGTANLIAIVEVALARRGRGPIWMRESAAILDAISLKSRRAAVGHPSCSEFPKREG